MPRAEDWARASEMNADLAGPSADQTAPTARSFFLGQLSEDEPGDVWEGEAEDVWKGEAEDVWADDPSDGGEGYSADPEEILDDEQDLDPLATSFETELQDPVATEGDATELSFASVDDEPTRVAAGAMPAVGARQAFRAARKQRGRVRLSRIALVAGVVAALAGGTAVYVGTHAKADNNHTSRSRSTSFDRRSPSTTATSSPSTSAAAPATEPAPDSAADPGAAAPSAPQGRTSSRAGASGSAAPTSSQAPSSTAAPPSSAAAPSSPPPRSPTCQVLPVLCR
jgi:hypothetical protein